MSKKAFVIGANTLGLKYAENDANLIRKCLSKYGYRIIIPPKSKNEIIMKFDEFIDTTSKTDMLIFYFSGHGYIQRGKFFLVIDDDLSKSKSTISITHITELFEHCRAMDKLIILDCCNAGTVATDWNLDQSDRYRILTASERLEKSKELDKYKSGFLTYFFYQALMNFASEVADQKGKIRINELRDWLEAKVRQNNLKPQAIIVPVPNLFGNHKANLELAEIDANISTKQADPTIKFSKTPSDLSNSVSLEILHSTCKKIIREQIKAVGHDKYIPNLYVNRKAEKEIETFINFEKIFLNQSNVILDNLIRISNDYHLGKGSSSWLLSAKALIGNIDSFAEYSNLIEELKSFFYYDDVENILKLIYTTIQEYDRVQFKLCGKKIISRLRNLPYITKDMITALPSLLFEAQRRTKAYGQVLSQDDDIMVEVYEIFPVKKTITTIGNAKIKKVKLANEFIKELNNLVKLQTQRCIALVSKAGYGKTNTMCRIAEELVKNNPTILLSGQMPISSGYDIEFHITRQIQTQLNKITSDWINLIASELKKYNKWLIIMIDGINENSNLSLFIQILKHFLPKTENKRIKLILSCRDIFWDLFSSTVNPYLFKGIITINIFTDLEWEIAAKEYLRQYNVTCKLDKQSRFALRNPLLLRFFCEAYRDHNVGEVANIKLLSVFDLYVERLSNNIAERFGFLNTDPIIEFLLKIGHEMWKTRSTNLSLFTLQVTPEEAEIATSIYNLVRAENIVLEENWHIYTTYKTIRFVYDEFMEYIIARSWANQFLISKISEESTEPLLQEAVNSISGFSPAFGSILFLDKMLAQNGFLINRAISLIDSTNDTFMASRQITMLYAFENMDVKTVDDKVIAALEKFEKVARNEIKERLAHIFLKILERQTGHPVLINMVKRILEIDFGKTSSLTVIQKELQTKMNVSESSGNSIQKKLGGDLEGLPPGRYHYTQETKLNAISILVASKNLEEYEIVVKGIRNMGQIDIHNALHALASLDFAPEELVYKTITKYLDKDNQTLPEYKIYCAWLLRERYGYLPAEYLTRLLTDDETRVHRYTYSLFEQRFIENELIESIIREIQKRPPLSSWHLTNLVLLLGKTSQFFSEDILKIFGKKIVTGLNLLRDYPQSSLRLEVYRSLLKYEDFIDFYELVRDMQKDNDIYIRAFAEKMIT